MPLSVAALRSALASLEGELVVVLQATNYDDDRTAVAAAYGVSVEDRGDGLAVYITDDAKDEPTGTCQAVPEIPEAPGMGRQGAPLSDAELSRSTLTPRVGRAADEREELAAAAYVFDRAHQYKPSSGIHDALCTAAADLRRQAHVEAFRHGELDDIIARWVSR